MIQSIKKEALLSQIREFENDIKHLRKKIKAPEILKVNRKNLIDLANRITSTWVEDLQDPLEHKFKLPKETIEKYSNLIRKLIILARPGNRSSSYLKVLNELLDNFQNLLVVPIKQFNENIKDIFAIENLVESTNPGIERELTEESIGCAQHGFYRASIILGWSAAMNRIHSCIMKIGLDKFNAASKALKNQNKGKFKAFNKEFDFLSISELQETADLDILIVLKGMNIIDSQEFGRLSTCYQYRINSAHPGKAPITDFHVSALLTDIRDIVFLNEKLNL